MNLEYSVKTKIMENCDILQNTSLMGMDGLRESIINRVIHAQEEGVRAALIKLGWTPPKPK